MPLLLRDLFDRHVVDARRRCLVEPGASACVQLPVSVQLPRLAAIPRRHAALDGAEVATNEPVAGRRPDEGPQCVRQQVQWPSQRVAVHQVHDLRRAHADRLEQHVAAHMRVFEDLARARHVMDLTELGAEASGLSSAVVQEHPLDRPVTGGGAQHGRHLLHRCLAALDAQLQGAAHVVGELEVQRLVDLVLVHGGDLDALGVDPLLHARRHRDRWHSAAGDVVDFSIDFRLTFIRQQQGCVGGPCVDPQPPVIDSLVEPIDLHFHVGQRHQPVVRFFLRQHVDVAICVEAFQRGRVVRQRMPDGLAFVIKTQRHGVNFDQTGTGLVLLDLQRQGVAQPVQRARQRHGRRRDRRAAELFQGWLGPAIFAGGDVPPDQPLEPGVERTDFPACFDVGAQIGWARVWTAPAADFVQRPAGGNPRVHGRRDLVCSRQLE